MAWVAKYRTKHAALARDKARELEKKHGENVRIQKREDGYYQIDVWSNRK